MRTLGVIVNPLARFHRKNPKTEASLRQIVEGVGRCDASEGLEHLEQIAQEYKASGIEVLAISGGDGTGTCTLTTFRRVYGDTPLPQVTFLRGGTMNTVAKGLGIVRGRPEALLRRLVAQCESSEPLVTAPRGTVDCNGQLGFIVGVGVIPGFLREYYAAGKSHPTPVTAAKTLGRVALSAVVGGKLAKQVASQVEVSVVADGARWDKDRFLTVAASTVPEIGLGFKPFFRVHEDVNQFHMVGYAMSAARFVANLPKVHAGKPLSSDRTIEQLATKASITFPEGAGHYTVDGDLFEAAVLELKAGPVLDIVIP